MSNSGERWYDFIVATSSKVVDRKTTDVEQMGRMIIFKSLCRSLIKSGCVKCLYVWHSYYLNKIINLLLLQFTLYISLKAIYYYIFFF